MLRGDRPRGHRGRFELDEQVRGVASVRRGHRDWWRAPRRTRPLVTDLLVGLRERGLDVTVPILAVFDGSKGRLEA